MTFKLAELGDNPEIIDFERDEGFSFDGQLGHFSIKSSVVNVVEDVDRGVRFLTPIAAYGDLRAKVLLRQFEQKQDYLSKTAAFLALSKASREDKSRLINNSFDEMAHAAVEAERDCERVEAQYTPVPYPDSIAYLDATFTEIDLILRRNGLEPVE